jgi:hypothetical protein
MSKDEFNTVFEQGYQAGYGHGITMGAICGILATACAVLLYWIVIR